MKRNFRYIKKGYGEDSLTDHEIEELYMDFDIDVKGYYVLAPLTKEEWGRILKAMDVPGD